MVEEQLHFDHHSTFQCLLFVVIVLFKQTHTHTKRTFSLFLFSFSFPSIFFCRRVSLYLHYVIHRQFLVNRPILFSPIKPPTPSPPTPPAHLSFLKVIRWPRTNVVMVFLNIFFFVSLLVIVMECWAEKCEIQAELSWTDLVYIESSEASEPSG